MQTVRSTTHPSTRNAIVYGLIVGVLYQLAIIPLQPLIEPTFTWAEVAIGVLLSFLVAERAVAGWEPEWRAYRLVLALAFLAQGVPIILHEILVYLVIPRLAR
ncbi:MAG: hypothetical protein WCI67_09020 [Chloroflexales bacterium]